MIEIIVGTNRRHSSSGILARWLSGLYSDLSVDARIMNLADLPPETFSPDAYKEKPVQVLSFTERVLNAKGLVVVTPEYNGSMPGALKLFIDLLPFPESFEGRPVCYIGLAAGQFGGLRPVEHLMQVFGYRNSHNYPQRVFLPFSSKIIDSELGIIDKDAGNRLREQASGFIDFCNKLKATD
ncbi:MAG: NAD(P)H-dependent oxidoreductase [Opitutae bacterium]